MQRGVNKVILVGNLGKDPEVKYSGNGMAIAHLTLATSETYKDKNTGDNVEKTEWHRIAAFRRLAEIMGEYLKKGSKIYIEGKLQTRKWKDAQGVDRWTTEIIANEMQMLDSRGGRDQPVQQPKDYATDEKPEGSPVPNDFDDDIPF